MDIPRTYLATVARAALAKVGNTEPHPLEIEQAIVELQGVMNVIARGTADLLVTGFEQAAAETLAQVPLNEWLIAWRKAQKVDAVIVDVPSAPEGAQTSPDDQSSAGDESGAAGDTPPSAEMPAEDVLSDPPAPTELEASPETAEPPKVSTKAKAKNK